MAEDQLKSTSYQHGNKIRRVTYVQSERVKIDEKGLRKALTAKIFDKYTKKSLDRKAMEDAMSAGDVDPMIVAKYITTEKSSPSLRLSEKDAEQ